MRFLLAACLLALTLAAAPGRADEPDLGEAIRGAKDLLKNKSGSGGVPPPPPQSGWLDSATFKTPLGLKVDRSCLGGRFEGSAGTPLALLAALDEMDRKLRYCASTMGLSDRVKQVYSKMPSVTVRCDPAGCSGVASGALVPGACSNRAKGTITFPDPAEYPKPNHLFHELGHHSDLDSQDTASHHSPMNRGKDEIYFWEDHCFDLLLHLENMRGWIWDKRSASRDSPMKEFGYDQFNEHAVEVCKLPFETRDSARYGAQERDICGRYARFFTGELRLHHRLRAVLAPLATQCAPDADCPAADSALGKKLASAGLALSPANLAAAGDVMRWAESGCFGKLKENAKDPNAALAACAQAQLDRETAYAAKLSAPELAAWRSHLSLVLKREKAAAPYRALDPFSEGYAAPVTEGEVRDLTRAAVAAGPCASDAALQGSAFCAELKSPVSGLALDIVVFLGHAVAPRFAH